jgi:hypothetical protein
MGNGADPLDYRLELAVQKGDRLRFIVSDGANPDFDTTYFSPVIDLGEPPCPSGVPYRCQMMAITYARSDDSGETYTQPKPPGHLVAASPYRFEESEEAWGIWQPSNIVRHPQDGYYYAALHVEDHAAQARGTCLMRTDRLDDPGSWRAWDGSGFNMAFANPYQTDLDPLEHICQPVSAEEIWTLTYSLTYNEYLRAFILLGHAVHVDRPGFYYSLSRDLIHWTPRTLLMEADLVQTTETPGRYLAYPSLIDPGSTERNFDVTGRRPYLFYSRFNDAPSGDADLVWVQLEFTR